MTFGEFKKYVLSIVVKSGITARVRFVKLRDRYVAEIEDLGTDVSLTGCSKSTMITVRWGSGHMSTLKRGWG